MVHIVFFYLEDTCLTMLGWFLLYNNVNQLHVYIHALALEHPAHTPRLPPVSFSSTRVSCALLARCLLTPPSPLHQARTQPGPEKEVLGQLLSELGLKGGSLALPGGT